MRSQDWKAHYMQVDLPSDYYQPAQSPAEKAIRWILLGGFGLVLLVEAWLIWELVSTWPL